MKAERLWLKATPIRSLRSLIFGLSLDPAMYEEGAAAKRRHRVHQATALAVWLVGLGAFAAFLAVTESVSVAIILPAIVVVGNAACGHYCAVRLERKLARLRASV
ncbi:MAG TPA: hypothetical protein VH721_05480, partial [Gaiellaceae bacterium]